MKLGRMCDTGKRLGKAGRVRGILQDEGRSWKEAGVLKEKDRKDVGCWERLQDIDVRLGEARNLKGSQRETDTLQNGKID